MTAASNNSSSDYQAPPDIPPEQLENIRQSLQSESFVQKMLGTRLPEYFDYDAGEIPLYEIIQDALVNKSITRNKVKLEELHKHLDPSLTSVDQHLINNVTRQFYEDVPGMDDALRKLREDYIYPLFPGERFAWQKTPTIRFHFPNAAGIDPDANRLLHIDSMIGHPVQEINIWLSLTDSRLHRSFNVASLPDSLDHLSAYDHNIIELHQALQQGLLKPDIQAVESTKEQFIVMDSRCIHGPAYNKSDITRVSLDFRIIRISDLESLPMTYTGCGRMKARFEIGHYYAY